jgi:hypothetical protein
MPWPLLFPVDAESKNNISTSPHPSIEHDEVDNSNDEWHELCIRGDDVSFYIVLNSSQRKTHDLDDPDHSQTCLCLLASNSCKQISFDPRIHFHGYA